MYHRASNAEPHPVTIRLTRPTDTAELRRVAQRDSRLVPDGEMLIAVVDGEIRAGISLSDGVVIADPVHRTEELVRMLSLRRTQMHLGTPKPLRRRLGLRIASG